MKRSYLLYGAFWDGKPIPKTAPKILKSCDLADMTVLSLKEIFEDPELLLPEFKNIINIIGKRLWALRLRQWVEPFNNYIIANCT